MCARIAASSRLEASRSGWSRAARMSATWCTTRSAAGCWRMTRQWRSRRWERCARRSRCASTNARSEAPPSRDASASAATASKISVRHARAAASSASVSSSLSGAEAPRGVGSREASPVEVTGAPSGAADAGSLGANPESPLHLPRRHFHAEGVVRRGDGSAVRTRARDRQPERTGAETLSTSRSPRTPREADPSRSDTRGASSTAPLPPVNLAPLRSTANGRARAKHTSTASCRDHIGIPDQIRARNVSQSCECARTTMMRDDPLRDRSRPFNPSRRARGSCTLA